MTENLTDDCCYTSEENKSPMVPLLLHRNLLTPLPPLSFLKEPLAGTSALALLPHTFKPNHYASNPPNARFKY